MKDNLNHFWRLAANGLCLFALFAATAVLSAPMPSGGLGINFPTESENSDSEESESSDIELPTWEVRKKAIDAFYASKVAEERKRLEQQITDIYTIEFIKTQIRRRVNTPSMGDFRILRIPGIEVDWSNFNQDPPKSKESIVDEIRDQAIEHAIDKIRPDERRQNILDTADERFRMVQINERVTLMLRDGRGPAAYIEDQPLRGVNDERVQLGSRFIIREDLDEEAQALFYPDVNARLKEAYIVNSLGKIDVELESFVTQECYEKTASGFLENNYVPDITKPTASLRTSKPDFWVSKKSFVQRIRKALVDLGVEAFEKQEMPRIMTQEGYYYVPTEDKKGMEWVDEIEKIARETLPSPSSNENGMPGPPPGMGPGPGGTY